MGVAWPIRVTCCSPFPPRSRSQGLPRSSFGFAAAAASSRERRPAVLRSPGVQESGRASRAEARPPAPPLATADDRRIVTDVAPALHPVRSPSVSSTAIREAIERDEAAAAEVETPEPEPEPDTPEPEPEPQPEPPTAKELEQLGRKIDAENERHAKRLQDLYGPMWADLSPCPLCDAEGHTAPIPLDQRDPAQIEAVHAALGEHEQPELMPMEGVERCPKCDGWGHVETPSRNDENRVKPCLECQTRGYREVMPGAVNYPIPVAVPALHANGAPPPPVWGEVDAWNRPAGHPHYGRDPITVT